MRHRREGHKGGKGSEGGNNRVRDRSFITGRAGTKWENRGSETFCAPTLLPSRQGTSYCAAPFLKCGNILPIFSIGPATRCDEIVHFAAILRVLGASQPIAAHRRSLLQNRSSVASQLGAINYFYFLLRFSSQRSHIELFN